jgi:hypothetical protein
METTQRYAYSEGEASPYDRGTVAAVFDTRDQAAHALRDLHEAGFHKTWMGVTRANAAPFAEHKLESAERGIGASLARFFGEDGGQSLYDALTKRGVPSSDALALDNLIHNGGAVVTVEAMDRYDDVFAILRQDRGEIASAASGLGSATSAESIATAAAEEDSDAPSGPWDDGPVEREELFIERLPVAGAAREAAAPSAEGATIRVPLMRERVVVDKRTVVL